MRLFEAIIEANHRAVAGDKSAGLHPTDYADELPIVALTCIDPRLNALFPQVLGLREDQFIWLRNAGNLISGASSSTLRSLALACALKGGKEIAIIGHTDCQVRKATVMDLIQKFREIGVERHHLPENLTEFFGLFASERQNVISTATLVRNSTCIGPKIPVHGMLVDTETGKLEWLVNGYQTLESIGARWNETVKAAGKAIDSLRPLTDFNVAGIQLPETKIGQAITQTEDWLSTQVKKLEVETPATPIVEESSQPQKPPPPPPPLRRMPISARLGRPKPPKYNK